MHDLIGSLFKPPSLFALIVAAVASVAVAAAAAGSGLHRRVLLLLAALLPFRGPDRMQQIKAFLSSTRKTLQASECMYARSSNSSSSCSSVECDLFSCIDDGRSLLGCCCCCCVGCCRGPQAVLIMALVFMGVVVMLHIVGKIRQAASA